MDGRLQQAGLLLRGGKIAAIGRDLQADGSLAFDGRGLTAGPGLVDAHVHGGGGHSFFTADRGRIRAYSAWAPRHGVTSFLVSTVGSDPAETQAILRGLRPALAAPGPGAEPLDFHLEGPFINPERKGAFPQATLRSPDAAELEAYLEAADGRLRVVTLAPELPGADRLIETLCRAGVLPAVGHTDATFVQASAAFSLGAAHVTHLFNAMRPLHQRDGGPIAAALLGGGVTCELICDGAHVAPEVLRLAYQSLGPSRTVVVTDNLYIAGTERSAGKFAGGRVSVSGAAARRDDGVIVGSVAPMDAHFRNAVDFFRIDIPAAFLLCSENPARVAGASARKGKLSVDRDADIVLLDDRLEVVATICRGEVAFCADPARLSR
jgi:N-acetylglucosamine-6-phosphate deacetylase